MLYLPLSTHIITDGIEKRNVETMGKPTKSANV